MRTAVTVEGKDIKNIGHGHAKYRENGMLNILCNGSTYGIEGILLRSILSCINPEYRIIGEGAFCYNNGGCVWEFKTNMPFAEYERISREELVMSNKEIVKAVLRETLLFNCAASVSKYSSECEVKVVTKAVFVRLSDLASLKLFIEQKGGRVKDIEVSPMPAMNNRLSVVVVFNR